MAHFSELEEAFFRAGEELSVLPADAGLVFDAEPEPPTFWQRLFRRTVEQWSAASLELWPVDVETYYASYELYGEAALAMAA
jgi:hypothetical protein